MTWYMDARPKREIRRILMAQQNGDCVYCGRFMTMEKQHVRKARFATVDHLVPIVQGGTNDRDNLVLSCRLCNNVKGDSTLEEFVFGLLWIWLCKNHPMVAWEIAIGLWMEAPGGQRLDLAPAP